MQWLESAPEGAPHLNVTTPLEEVEAASRESDVLVLEFDAFRDGRGFSLASVLRERGYAGKLVAAGKLIPDQARHLARSGFDAVVLEPGADTAPWARMGEAFSAVYQPAVDTAQTVWKRRGAARQARPDVGALAERLNADADEDDPRAILRAVLNPELGLKAAVLSSFGAEAAALLAIVAEVDPTTPVLFVDTGMHFMQTVSYRRKLSERLGLTDVRIVRPEAVELAQADPDGQLWSRDSDACCDVRKVQPTERGLAGIDVLITGRKRHQTAERSAMTAFEPFEGRLRVNPLMNWTAERIEQLFASLDLPRHPLVEQGYRSIGCWPCTRAVEAGEDARAGRWSGEEKTECGIHLGRRVLAEA